MTDSIAVLGGVEGYILNALTSADAYAIPLLLLATFFFGELVVFVAFMLVQQGFFTLNEVIFISFLGLLTIDVFWFLVGRYFPIKFLPSRLRKNVLGPVTSFFDVVTKQNILQALVTFKFFIGVRIVFVVYLSGRPLKFLKFFFYDAIAMMVYVGALTIAGLFIGEVVSDVFSSYKLLASLLTGVFLIFLLGYISKNNFAKKVEDV